MFTGPASAPWSDIGRLQGDINRVENNLQRKADSYEVSSLSSKVDSLEHSNRELCSEINSLRAELQILQESLEMLKAPPFQPTGGCMKTLREKIQDLLLHLTGISDGKVKEILDIVEEEINDRDHYTTEEVCEVGERKDLWIKTSTIEKMLSEKMPPIEVKK